MAAASKLGSVYQNSDHAGTPESFKSFVTGGARGGGGFQQVVRIAILVAETEREVERAKGLPGICPLDDIHLIGTPNHVAETLRGVIEQGAHRLPVNFADVPGADGTTLFAAAVLPQL